MMESRMHQVSDQFSRDFNGKARVTCYTNQGPKETYITDTQLPNFAVDFGRSNNNEIKSLDRKLEKDYGIDKRIYELEQNAETAYVQWRKEQDKLREEKRREKEIRESLERLQFEKEQLRDSLRDQIFSGSEVMQNNKSSYNRPLAVSDLEYTPMKSSSIKLREVPNDYEAMDKFQETRRIEERQVLGNQDFAKTHKPTNDDFNFHQIDMKTTSPGKIFHYHDEPIDYKNIDVEKLDAASKHCAACEQKYKLLLNMVNPYREKQRLTDETIRKILIQLKALFVSKKHKEAEELVENTLNDGYKHADIYYMAGEIKRALNLFNDSEVYYLQALTFQVHSPYVYQSLGLTYINLNNHKRAIPLLKHFTDKIVSDSANFELGKCLAVCKSYLEATVYFGKAIQINPRVGDYYLHRGDSYEALGFMKLAIDDYRAFTKITPNYREIFEKNIRDLERHGRFEEANSFKAYLRKITV